MKQFQEWHHLLEIQEIQRVAVLGFSCLARRLNAMGREGELEPTAGRFKESAPLTTQR